MILPHDLKRGVLLLAVWSMAAVPLQIRAGEMQVQGRIIDVVPVGQTHGSSSGALACQPQRPDSRAGLAALLAWDLRTQCSGRPAARPASEDGVSGYRVYYRWDGRTYQHVVRQPPAGDTISLRVRVD
ncbi:MAG: hypothetical protein U5Q16_01660 [Gammaproteobacteria bacterium]|nr:hypothetical protein [Gammaproteobacteria bacterium]